MANEDVVFKDREGDVIWAVGQDVEFVKEGAQILIVGGRRIFIFDNARRMFSFDTVRRIFSFDTVRRIFPFDNAKRDFIFDNERRIFKAG